MKHENTLRLAHLANADTYNGGARALCLAERARRITGSSEAVEIVSNVYARSNGRATYECRECGQEWLTVEECGECCAS